MKLKYILGDKMEDGDIIMKANTDSNIKSQSVQQPISKSSQFYGKHTDNTIPGTQKGSSTTIKRLIIFGLILGTIGIIIYSISSDYVKIEENISGALTNLVGKLFIEIGMMLSSIMLIVIALFKEDYDITLRFGCLLISGIIIAFIMITFL